MDAGDTHTHFRTCPLCEAGCGLEITLRPRAGAAGDWGVARIRGDRDDVFSRGFICPKGSALKHLHEDADWLRGPMVKRNGRFVPATWDEAFADFLPADQYEAVEHQRTEHLHQSAYTPFEHEIIRLSGEERVVETVAVGVPFEGVEAVQMVLRDVTDRKRSEERYRNFVQTISEGVWRIDLTEPISALTLPYLQAERILEQGYLAECNTMMTRLFGAVRTEAIVGKPIHTLIPALDRRLLHSFIEDGYRLHNHELTVQRKGQSPRHFALNAVGRLERGALVLAPEPLLAHLLEDQ